MMITKTSPFYSNIRKIVGFFTRASGSGFLFCACDQTSQIGNINRQIMKRTAEKGKFIGLVGIPSPNAFLDTIRGAAHDCPQGFIVNNLNQMILQSGEDFIREMNFSRDILISMNVPMMFWLSEENISRFANLASDFFIRRDRGVISFPGLSGHSALDGMTPFFSTMHQASENYADLKINIELLEKQLAEAEQRGYDEKRIALEIGFDLIDLYNKKAFLRDEALALFEKYGKHFKKSHEARHREVIADLFLNIGKYDDALDIYLESEKEYNVEHGLRRASEIYSKIGRVLIHKGDWYKAIDYFLKAKKNYQQLGDVKGLCSNLNNIGTIYLLKGEWDKSMEHFTKVKKLNLEEEEPCLLVATSNIGIIYMKKGEFNEALKLFCKSRQIYERLGYLPELAVSYQRIGCVYEETGKFDKALSHYLKSEKLLKKIDSPWELGALYNSIGLLYDSKSNYSYALEFLIKSLNIRIKLQDKRGLGVVYSNMGLIYERQGKWDKAVETFFKAEAINIEVENQEGLACSWYNLGTIFSHLYYNQKSRDFLLAAGYLKKIIGTDHEIEKWKEVVEPLLNELGEDRFMAEGELVYNRFMAEYKPEARKKEMNEFILKFKAWKKQKERMDGEPVTMKMKNKSKIGRNAPCPCASGKKYKKCCLNKTQANTGRL